MNAFIELRIISDELRLSPFDEIPYMSDEIIGIIGIPAICEYTLRPVDICSF